MNHVFRIENDWEFLLRGNSMDLRELSTKLGSGYFHVYEEPSPTLDCSVDDYRMTSLYCNDQEDARIAWQYGYELVSLYNGAKAMVHVDHRKIEIEKIWLGGREVKWHERDPVRALLGKPRLTRSQVAQEHMVASSGGRSLLLLNLATEHQDIYIILKYFDMPAGWENYYKILESVESFAKLHGIDVQLNKKSRANFTNVANNYSLAGFSARHGFEVVLKENKTGQMTYEESHNFIRQIARTYLDARVKQIEQALSQLLT